MLFVWYRRSNREAGWLILPSLLPSLAAAILDVGSGSIFTGWGRLDFLANPIPVGPFPLQVPDVGDFLFVLGIGVVMFHRFTQVSRQQARGAAELDAAREMQRRLVPEILPEIAGYALEAAYFPAEEVGGDFYQVLDSRGGAKLVVVGDVSGKGLKAAMTGTLAMGALRALATEGLGPGAVLTLLNRQLVESGHEGFVTCLCARVAPHGEVTVANAVRPSLEISYCPSVSYGLATLATCGIVWTCLSSGSIALRTVDDWTVPVVVWNTIWSTSPPCEGNSLLSRSTTCWDSVLGRLKSFAYWRPTAVAITVIRIAINTQPTTTIRR